MYGHFFKVLSLKLETRIRIHIRICIKETSRIRIRIRIKVVSRIRICINGIRIRNTAFTLQLANTDESPRAIPSTHNNRKTER